MNSLQGQDERLDARFRLSLVGATIRRGGLRTAGFLMPFLIAALASSGSAAPAAYDCAPYRAGLLSHEKFAIYTDFANYYVRNIAFRKEYITVPDIPCGATVSGIGKDICGSESFHIHMLTGAPVSPIDQRCVGVPHQECEDISILIQGRAWLPLSGNLAATMGRPPPPNRVDAYKFRYTGERIGDFNVIHYPEDEGKITYKRKTGVRLDRYGYVKDVLSCRIATKTFINPSCHYDVHVGPLNVRAHIKQFQLPHLQTIIRHVKAFSACLLSEGG